MSVSLGDEDDEAEVEVKKEKDIRVGVMVSGGTRVTCSFLSVYIYLTLFVFPSFSSMFVLTFAFPVN